MRKNPRSDTAKPRVRNSPIHIVCCGFSNSTPRKMSKVSFSGTTVYRLAYFGWNGGLMLLLALEAGGRIGVGWSGGGGSRGLKAL